MDITPRIVAVGPVVSGPANFDPETPPLAGLPARSALDVCWYCRRPIWFENWRWVQVVRGNKGGWSARAHRSCFDAAHREVAA